MFEFRHALSCIHAQMFVAVYAYIYIYIIYIYIYITDVYTPLYVQILACIHVYSTNCIHIDMWALISLNVSPNDLHYENNFFFRGTFALAFARPSCRHLMNK